MRNALLRKALINAAKGDDARVWSAYLEYKAEQRLLNPRDQRFTVKRGYMSELDVTFTDAPPFSGNEMRRFRHELEDLGLNPTFRTVVSMDEDRIQDILSHQQIGRGACDLINDIRDEDSVWARMYRQEAALL